MNGPLQVSDPLHGESLICLAGGEPSIRWSHRHETLLVGLILGGLLVAAFPRVFFLKEVISPAGMLYAYSPWAQLPAKSEIPPPNYVLSDEVDSTIPLAKYMREQFLRGDLPTWCDKTQNGAPLFWVIAHEFLLAPLLLLVLLLDVPWGITVFALLRQWVGGLFFYKYTRVMGLGRWASLCGAVVFSYGSFPIQTFGRPLSFQLMLLPATAYAIERIIRHRSLLWCAALPFLLQLNILSGFPAGTFYCFYFLTLYATSRLIGQAHDRLRTFALLLGLGVLSVLLCAPAMVASTDYFSGFDWDFRSANYWRARLPRVSALTQFVPFLCGEPNRQCEVFEPSAKPFWWFEHGIYIGALPIAVVALSVLHFRRAPGRVFFILFAVWLFIVLFNLGSVLDNFLRYLPVFGSNRNVRQKVLLFFIMSVLFAWGLDDIARGFGRRRNRLITTLAILPLAGVVAVGVFHRCAQAAPNAFVRAHLWLQVPILLLAGLLVLRLRTGRCVSRSWRIGILAFVFLDLQAMDRCSVGLVAGPGRTAAQNLAAAFFDWPGRGWNSTLPTNAFFPETPGIRFLCDHLGTHKMLALRTTFLANSPLYFGLNNLGGRAFVSKREKALYQIIADDAFSYLPPTLFFFSDDLERTHLDRTFIDALGIKYVLLEPGQTVDDLRRTQFIRQAEWNSFVSLTPGHTISQSFVAGRSHPVNQFSVRAAEYQSSDARQITLRIRTLPEGGATAQAEAVWKPGTGTLRFDLAEPFEFTANIQYSIELAMKKDADGWVHLLCTKDVDVIPQGQVFVDQTPWNGDLTFSACLDLGPQYLIHQPEWSDSIPLWPGDRVVTRFTAGSRLIAESCEFQVEANRFVEDRQIDLALRDLTEGTSRTFSATRWDPEKGKLSFGLKGFEFQSEHEYELELSMPREAAGPIVLRCSDTDSLPGASLTVNGQPRDADLSFSVRTRSSFELEKYRVVYQGEFTVLENTAVFDRAFLVGGLRFAEDEEILNALRNDAEDLHKCAWGHPADQALVGEPLRPQKVQGTVAADVLQSGYQRFTAQADRNCFLIVSDNYDKNWRAWVDHRETPIFRVDFNLRGIRLPAGRHSVEFRYHPPHFAPAVAVALLSAVGFFLSVIVCARRRRRSTRLSAQCAADH
jgi:hypothetical protein